MSIRLDCRLPYAPEGSIFRFSTETDVHAQQNCRPSFEDRLAIEKIVGEVEGIIRTFGILAVAGQVSFTVYPNGSTSAGELTTFFHDHVRLRDLLLREIDAAITTLRKECGSCFSEIVFTLKQTCEVTLEEGSPSR